LRFVPLKTHAAWWQKGFDFKIFNAADFVDCWEKHVIEVATGKTKNKSQESALQLLSDQTKNLWKSFTTNRSELDREYMSTDKFLSAYLASFLIPNIERTRHIFDAPRNAAFMLSLFEKEELSILDFGSGPLSSSFGFIIALEQSLQKRSEKSHLKRLRIVAVERSEKAVQISSRWLKQHVLSSVELEVSRVTSIPNASDFDVILASNVINEIPKKHQLSTVKSLLRCFQKSTPTQACQLLILEPAQEEFAKGLSALRDEIIESSELSHIKIEGPCLHHSACPLSEKMKRRDWCWSKAQFVRPPFLIELDRRTDIDHSELAFSYLLLSNSADRVPPKAKALSVSDQMLLTGDEGKDARYQYFKSNQHKSSKSSDKTIEKLSQSCTKQKLCTSDGELLAGLRLANQMTGSGKRGDLIEHLEQFDGVVHER